MSVASLDWLIWMSATVAVFWAMPARFRDVCIPTATMAYLLSHAPLSAALLTAFALGTYFAPAWFRSSGSVTVAVGSAIVLVLVFFKLHAAGAGDDLWIQVAIPLGLSYYAFRCLHYVIERYKGTLVDHGFRDFAAYLIFIPTLAAGPIHRFDQFQRDYRRHRWDSRLFSAGLERILFGYVKVVVLANQLVNVNLLGFVATLDPQREWLVAYLELLAYAMNGYLQFAGYSDIAIGFAMLLGYRVMENFNWPFLARNVSQFWQRWHISLSSWCRDYIYLVVTSLTRRPTLAIVLSMLILGLWHEISLRYTLWGLYHGAGIALWHAYKRLVPGPSTENVDWRHGLGHGAAVVLTFHFVLLSFVILHQASVAEMLDTYELLLLGWW
jgi:alginate O-acetyltransferase complex protein AlgI